MMIPFTNQIVSKQRVSEHGEVYTNEREVNAMLDLVQSQCERIDARFLEPACGNGNFLAAILERKLAIVTARFRKTQIDYEKNAVIAAASLYGIELLPDNAALCRARLVEVFEQHYRAVFPKTIKASCIATVSAIFAVNIIEGDALSLQHTGGEPIVFAEWSLIGSRIHRRDFVYRDLLTKSSERELPLFSDLGDAAFIPEPVRDYPLVHFLELAHV